MEANFCLSCGSALDIKDINGTARKACPQCDFIFWGNYSIGVGALVIKNEKVLLVRRAEEPGKGNWTTPGGYIEQFEFIEATIEREVLEETGIMAKATGIVAVRDLPRNIHNVYIAFSMDYISGEPIADGIEVDAAGFFSWDEMQTMKVASLTKWLVDIGLHKKSLGLLEDKEPLASLETSRLFCISE